MDKSLPVGVSSDLIPEHFCEQFNQTDETANSIAGYSLDGHMDFCFDCYSSIQRSMFIDHHFLNQSTIQTKEQPPQFKDDNSDESENQTKSLDHNLDKLENNTTVNELKFESDEKLNTLLNDLNVRRKVYFKKSPNASVARTKGISIDAQKRKKPNYLQDIELKFNSYFRGSLMLPNQQMILMDYVSKRLKLIDSTTGTMVTKINITGMPVALTKTKKDEIAVTTMYPDSIMFVSVSKYFLLKGRKISLKETCRGIAYNDKDKTFIAAFVNPPKVEILNMYGQVLKRVYKDSKGDAQFFMPNCVGISPDMTTAYIGDYRFKGTVTLMTMEGEIKAIYENKYLQSPNDIYVHKSGLVYIVGCRSHTLHQLDPDNGQFKLLLERKDGLEYPASISYCDLENKMYIVNHESKVLKVFKMK